ncbi:ead/Ea22-like family protein [Klebsiella sp. 141153]|uniref:ead/Ea22-like family protein n=1 Tax=Klebsiella sp. 141153 TaxID=3020033 RepID=UPI00292780C5|nr:ead/Ea22-like family protein [Klebsiella sp. 141153]MDU9355286.1 ead/Ea22-like family protein [Klebsiella sp. 141153]
MTDITELAQSLKAAAEKASNGEWVKESGDGWEASCSDNDQANGGFIIAHFEGPDAAENREFVQAANPANVIALVEALEKAQQRNGELETYSKTTLEFREAARDENRHLKLELEIAEKRIAELESHTVTVKLPEIQQPIDGTGYANAAGARYYKECVIKSLTAHGIKWEDE